MVKKTTTAKKISVTSSKSPKKTAAAKASPKAAKATKTVKKKTAATKAAVKKTAKVAKKAPTVKKSAATKAPIKKQSTATKTAVKKPIVQAAKSSSKAAAKAAPVPSPVRKVEEVEHSGNQFSGTWMLILIGVLLFVAGLGWWVARDSSGVSVEAESVETDTYSDGFQPTINVIEN